MEEEDREIGKVGDRPAQLNEKKSDRELEQEIRSHFLLEEQHENFVAAVRKWEMIAATKVKMSDSEKKKKSQQEHLRHFLQKNV